jgi:hypothetical protein
MLKTGRSLNAWASEKNSEQIKPEKTMQLLPIFLAAHPPTARHFAWLLCGVTPGLPPQISKSMPIWQKKSPLPGGTAYSSLESSTVCAIS